MTMSEWAKKEVEIACKKENPEWDGESFDYGCSCYQSALKAFESLCDDEHSGFSFSLTKNILIRLMENLPLTPITDEDFVITKDTILESPKYLKERGFKSDIQCPRMSSLFRYETLDGKVSYHDVDRAIGIDEKGHSYGSGSISKYVDKLFPITMPYYPPTRNRYRVYTEEFLLDEAKGDYDHKAYLYLITPNGEKIEINEFFQEDDNGQMIQISKELYYEHKKNRVDLEEEEE